MTFSMSEKAQTIKVYNFRVDTNEYIGASDSYIPPHTGLPANCTTVKPGNTPDGFVSVFDVASQSWVKTEDHRGQTVYSIDSGASILISVLGPLPENVTSCGPNGMFESWNGTEWVKDEKAEQAALIAQNQEQKNNLMKLANANITPLQDAVDLDLATDDEKNDLIEWKKFRIEVNRVDVNNPIWPVKE